MFEELGDEESSDGKSLEEDGFSSSELKSIETAFSKQLKPSEVQYVMKVMKTFKKGVASEEIESNLVSNSIIFPFLRIKSDAFFL